MVKQAIGTERGKQGKGQFWAVIVMCVPMKRTVHAGILPREF
jgi:hypothetical protein